jgi:hypothetical protein
MFITVNSKAHVVDVSVFKPKNARTFEISRTDLKLLADAGDEGLEKMEKIRSGLQRSDGYPRWVYDSVNKKLVGNVDKGEPLSVLRDDGKAKDAMGNLIVQPSATAEGSKKDGSK